MDDPPQRDLSILARTEKTSSQSIEKCSPLENNREQRFKRILSDWNESKILASAKR